MCGANVGTLYIDMHHGVQPKQKKNMSWKLFGISLTLSLGVVIDMTLSQ